jgi:hypothetical protein
VCRFKAELAELNRLQPAPVVAVSIDHPVATCGQWLSTVACRGTSTAGWSLRGPPSADVFGLRAAPSADVSWTFQATAHNPETGWDGDAEGWDVLTPGGAILKPRQRPFARLLLQLRAIQPGFTRSKRGIANPKGVREVRVHAHDLMDGYAGREVIVDLTTSSVGGFEVEQP